MWRGLSIGHNPKSEIWTCQKSIIPDEPDNSCLKEQITGTLLVAPILDIVTRI